MTATPRVADDITFEERIVDVLAEIVTTLGRMEQRIDVLEQFVTDARTAIEAMPAVPFMPKFQFRGKKDAGGT